jgi:putative membrane protein
MCTRFSQTVTISVLTLSLSCGSNAVSQATMGSGTSASSSSPGDQKFAMKAMEGGMAEVQLGKLAQQKASASDVKQFGEQMVTDHTKLNDQMQQLAPALGVTPPTQLSAKDQALQQKLENLSGDQFDKEYLKAMVSDHKKDLSEFRKEAGTTQNPQLKDAAQQGATVIQSHLRMVEGLAKTHQVSTGHMKAGL